MKINLRTVIVYVVIAMIVIGTALFLIYINLQRSLITSKRSELETIADLKITIIDNYFDNVKTDLVTARDYFNIKTNLPIVIRYANDHANAQYIQAKKILDAQLQAWLKTDGVVDVKLTNASGIVVYATNPGRIGEIGSPLPDPNNLAFINGETGIYISDIFLNKRNNSIPTFIGSVPIHDDGGNFLGVTAFEIDASNLYQLIQNTSGLGTTGETLIGRLEQASGTTGNVLILNPLRSNPNAAFNLKIPIGSPIGKPIQMAVQGLDGSGIDPDYQGIQTVAAWRYLPDRKWGLVAKINLAELLGPINALGILLIVLSILSAVTAAMVIFFLSKRSFDQFKLAVDNSAEQIVITDPDGMVLYANNATEKITGYTPHEALGKKSGTLWSLPMPTEFYRNLWKTVKTDKKTFIGELRNRRKNGEAYEAELKIAPVLDKKNNVIFFVGIERDITKEKELERAKNEFLSLTSHQLRTPPSIISWYTEVLQSGDLGPVNGKQADYLKEISTANQRMVDIINSLLNISRIEMGTFAIAVKEIDIKDIVDETIKELKKRFPRNIEIRTNYDPAMGLVKTDPNLMQMIIDNLLSNSIKYTVRENAAITITTKIEDDSFLLSVNDNGIGIPIKDQHRIFEKIFRADNAITANPDGTGLGLYMIKKVIVDGLGGTIRFESKENKGTTFYVSLPVSGTEERSDTAKLTGTP